MRVGDAVLDDVDEPDGETDAVVVGVPVAVGDADADVVPAAEKNADDAGVAVSEALEVDAAV